MILRISILTFILLCALFYRLEDFRDAAVNERQAIISLISDYEKESRSSEILNALSVSDCAKCHGRNNFLPKANLSLKAFKNYVRGEYRWVERSVMPKYPKSILSDAELEHMYKIIYQ